MALKIISDSITQVSLDVFNESLVKYGVGIVHFIDNPTLKSFIVDIQQLLEEKYPNCFIHNVNPHISLATLHSRSDHPLDTQFVHSFVGRLTGVKPLEITASITTPYFKQNSVLLSVEVDERNTQLLNEWRQASGDLRARRRYHITVSWGLDSIPGVVENEIEELVMQHWHERVDIELFDIKLVNTVYYKHLTLNDYNLLGTFFKNQADFSEGFQLLHRFRYNEAIDAFDRVLAQVPHHHEVLLYRGMANFYLENYQASQEDLQFVTAQGVDEMAFRNAWFFLGLAQLGSNDLDAAECNLTRVAELLEHDALTKIALGVLAFMKNDVDGGITWFHAALDTDPSIFNVTLELNRPILTFFRSLLLEADVNAAESFFNQGQLP